MTDNITIDVPKERCCDLCNPTLLDHIRPGIPIVTTRQKAIKKGVLIDSVRDALYTWRRNTKRKHYPNSIFSPQAILSDTACTLLASIGPITSKARLQDVLMPSWQRWDTLADELYLMLSALNPPSEPAPISNTPFKPQSTARGAPSVSTK